MKIKQLHEYENGTAIELAPVTIPDAVVNPETQENLTDALERIEESIPSEVTESTVSGWGFTKNTGTYSKPGTGIPKTDLASAVQTSLGKADTALQSYTEKYTGTITGIKMNGSSKGTSGVVDLGTVITAHQDISGKLDATVAASTYLTKTDAASTYLGKTAKAASAASADSATKATQDASGNVITSTYATKSALSGLQTQINTLVSGDASSAIESFNEITAFLEGVEDTETLDGIIAGINTEIGKKADKSEAIKSISRSGTTFTATRVDGTTFTFSQQDNNTTYTFAGGTNKFTVTPSGGSAQEIAVTPSISNNVTYSGTLTSGQVAVYDGTAGKIKSSGYTIASSVPSGAKFTDNNTTYTFAGGSGGFTVTPSGGSAQTVSIGKPSTAGTADKAGQLTTARTIDGVSFNGSAGITHYGECGTAAATTAKTVSLTGFALSVGARAVVKFTVTNTAANPTLNVNSTGAKNIMYRGSAISAGLLAANRVYEFVYDGTDYELVGDINTLRDVTDSVSMTDSSTSASATAVKAAYDKAVSAYNLANGKTSNTGTVTSVATGVGLTGGSITTSGTVKAKLRSETALTVDSAAAMTTSGRVYPVAVDKSGYLSVNVPWTDQGVTDSEMTADEATAGTATVARTITAKVLNDKIKEMTGSMSSEIPIVDHGTSDTSLAITPNVFHKWGIVSDLTLTLATPTDTTVANYYMFQFTSGATATTLSVPSSITWANKVAVEANKTYQISILNNLGVMGGF